MGKYRQWLHHQEIGRRLRDQINTYEQERVRVQKMAPAHPTALPPLENPIIAALLNYTQQGHKLSDIDVIKAAMPKLDPDLDRLRPAGKPATAKASATPAPVAAAQAADTAVVASLLARAENIPSDPLDQMRELSRAREEAESKATQAPVTGEAPRSGSVGDWWQRQHATDTD
ncbi:MAG: hypothetical protein OJF49_001126 [Ktedonobacterales bacterium]|jgi:hypothetical protein|nr:MAG: hypothetical protein OJF49_001126 [Ktedonobacterales bacterium]